MVTNFSSCQLGMALTRQLAASPHIEQVVAVSHDAENPELLAKFGDLGAKIQPFQAFANEAEDRSRLVAYMKQRE